MKKSFMAFTAIFIVLTMLFSVTAAAATVKESDYNLFTWNDGAPMTVNGKGQFVSDGMAWKMAEFKKAPTGDFTVTADILTLDGNFNDSINFYQHDAAFFAITGYDRTRSYGVFFNTRVAGILDIYICKWAAGKWAGFLNPEGYEVDYFSDSEVLKDAGDEVTLSTTVKVSGTKVTAFADVKSTGKKTQEVVFDISKQFNGENSNNAIPLDGTVAFTTQRMVAAPIFSNISITDTTGELIAEESEPVASSTEASDNSSDSTNGISSDNGTESDEENDGNLTDSSDKDTNKDEEKSDNSALLYTIITIVIVVVLASGAVVAILIKKNKEKQSET